MVEHSAERDEVVMDLLKDTKDSTVMELLGVARKWRSKATMRAARIEELEAKVKELEDDIQGYWEDAAGEAL